ncbi:MAG: Asp23/Gls24 family envelope stress response protein [Thermoleophilaceae bacterium]
MAEAAASTRGGLDGDQKMSLESTRGSTSVADAVVSKVAGIAAREVPGVYALGGAATRALGAVTSRVGISDERTQGVTVEVGEKEAAVDLTLIVDYGESIPQVSKAIRDNVIKRIEGIVGLTVTEVNIAVTDLYFPGDDDASEG